jgi:hypothetical protein
MKFFEDEGTHMLSNQNNHVHSQYNEWVDRRTGKAKIPFAEEPSGTHMPHLTGDPREIVPEMK